MEIVTLLDPQRRVTATFVTSPLNEELLVGQVRFHADYDDGFDLIHAGEKREQLVAKPTSASWSEVAEARLRDLPADQLVPQHLVRAL